MSQRAGKFIIAGTAVVASVFFGINFWKPIVIAQLERDGNLREDIDTSELVKDDQSASWKELKHKFEAVMDPEKNFNAEDQKQLEELKTRLELYKPGQESEKK